jgi:hypothetical protein
MHVEQTRHQTAFQTVENPFKVHLLAQNTDSVKSPSGQLVVITQFVGALETTTAWKAWIIRSKWAH